MALNELLGAFPSVQSWFSHTWHPGSLLRNAAFKTIICQQSPSLFSSVYTFKVIMCIALSHSFSLLNSCSASFLFFTWGHFYHEAFRLLPTSTSPVIQTVRLSRHSGCCGFLRVQIQSATRLRGIRMTGREEGKRQEAEIQFEVYTICISTAADSDKERKQL